jgi:putative ABC transport system permease protein
MVLIATGISFASFLQTRGDDPGFERDGVWLAAYDLSGRPRTPATTRVFNATLLRGLQDVPGVSAAAIASAIPLDIHGLPLRVFTLEGRARTEQGNDQASSNTVTPGYFEVMGIPFSAGGDFAPLDDPSAPLQVIVNDAFVSQYLDGGEAIGRRLVARARNHVIAGVVRNTIVNNFGEPPTPTLYFSYRDNALPAGEIHLKVQGRPATAVADDVRRVMQQADAEVPLFNVRSLTQHVDTNLFLRRIPFQMFVVIGPLLLVLLSMGIYAVVAYSSSLRRTEVGVRLAMGALPRQIVSQFVGESFVAITIGGAAGWLLAFQFARSYVPAAMSMPVFVFVPLVLLTVAAVACWVPARAASRLDPTIALRPD